MDKLRCYAAYAPVVLFNLIPLYCVVILDWKMFDILFLYWLEMIVIAAIHTIRLFLAQPTLIIFMAFVSFVFLGFCSGLFMMFLDLFGTADHKAIPHDEKTPLFVSPDYIWALIQHSDMVVALASLSVYQLYGWANDFMKDHFKFNAYNHYLFYPFRRLVVLQVGLLIGGLISLGFQLDNTMAVLIIFIMLKVALDMLEQRSAEKGRGTILN